MKENMESISQTLRACLLPECQIFLDKLEEIGAEIYPIDRINGTSVGLVASFSNQTVEFLIPARNLWPDAAKVSIRPFVATEEIYTVDLLAGTLFEPYKRIYFSR